MAIDVRSERIIIATCIALVTALAWAYLIYLDQRMSSSASSSAAMANMGMVLTTSWSARDFFFAFVMWSVMMVGMMIPSASPLFFLFAKTQTGAAQRGGSLTVLLFGLGYITIWVGFSAVAALMQLGLHQAALLSPAMSVPNRYLAAAILIGAGAFQFTPLKRTCLRHCQTPAGFLMTHWRSGRSGAFQMGLRHGTFCLGCCWAVMIVLFVVGIMNLVWVGLLAAFILVEKIGPQGGRVAQIGGAIMIASGLLLAIAG